MMEPSDVSEDCRDTAEELGDTLRELEALHNLIDASLAKKSDRRLYDQREKVYASMTLIKTAIDMLEKC